MPRSYKSTEIFVKPDSKFNSKLVSKMINGIMWEGKKAIAQRIFYDAMDLISTKVKDVTPLEVFVAAINNVKPQVEVRSKRVGGANYQVPMEVRKNRQQSLALRWILEAARAKKGKPMARRLAEEITDAFNRTGSAITKRENVHKMAEANKAFAHFAW